MIDFERRDLLKLMGIGFVSAGTAGTFAQSALAASPAEPSIPTEPMGDTKASPETTGDTPWWLIAPLVAGSNVAGVHLRSMTPIENGVLAVEFGRFQVLICRRDDAVALPPPARSRNYDFLLANGGKGDRQTSRAEGEAVIALARAVWRNETAREPLPLVTMHERWASMDVDR